jgi:hemoglobin-like flavoprotein
MKNLRLTWGMLAFSVFLTFTACQKEDLEPTTELTGTEFQLADLPDLEAPSVTGQTETDEFRCKPGDSTRVHALVTILKQLNLDENQRKAIKGFARQHQQCVAEHLIRINLLHKELLQKANQAREEQLKAFKEGKITRAQLEERLTAIRTAVQEELAKHEVKQLHMRAVRKCRLELVSKIESVLNQQQLQKWNTWKASLI